MADQPFGHAFVSFVPAQWSTVLRQYLEQTAVQQPTPDRLLGPVARSETGVHPMIRHGLKTL
ncbi:MAG: hypothetical protein VB036_14795, partial [Propionicimonas sp.]|nr:hypothetical protein [Propionicimonas sp.]